MTTPFFPTTVNPPDQDGYVYTPGKDFIETKLDGGASRVRRDVFGMVHTVKCCWSCTQDQYTQVMGFFRERVQSRSKLFRINLVIDVPTLVPYLARLTGTPNALTMVAGLLYKIEATLEVIPNPIKTFSLFLQDVTVAQIVDAGTADYTGDMSEFPVGRQVILTRTTGIVTGVSINLDGTYTIATAPNVFTRTLGASAPTINPAWTTLNGLAPQSYFPPAGAAVLVPL